MQTFSNCKLIANSTKTYLISIIAPVSDWSTQSWYNRSQIVIDQDVWSEVILIPKQQLRKCDIHLRVKATTAGPQQVYQHCYVSLNKLKRVACSI